VQANNALLQRDALHDPVRLTNKPHVVVEVSLNLLIDIIIALD